jgi:hypothetical protein
MEGDVVTVTAGALREDLKQGVLFVMVRGEGRETIAKRYPTPGKHGTLRIEGFIGFILNLTAEDKSQWMFDVLKGELCKIESQQEANITNSVFVSDCSKIQIPMNVALDTNLDNDKGLLTVYWYDEQKAKDVAITFNYKDQSCSDSAKKIIDHVLNIYSSGSSGSKGKVLEENHLITNSKYSYSIGIPNHWEGNYEYQIKEGNIWFRYVSKDNQFRPTIFYIQAISKDETEEFESNPENEFIKLGEREGLTFYSIYPLDFELDSESEIDEYNQMSCNTGYFMNVKALF